MPERSGYTEFYAGPQEVGGPDDLQAAMAALIACPVCGGQVWHEVPAGTPACPYCGTSLATPSAAPSIDVS